MKTSLKVAAGLIGLLVVLLGGIAVFLSRFDPNAHKQAIVDLVKARTGRDLTLAGDIQVSFYPWLGLEANGVTLGNPPGFGEAPFLVADHFEARAKLLPLLVKSIEMDTVRINGAEVNLARNAAGADNWSDLVKGDEKEKGEPIQLAALAIGGLDIKDARFTWADATQGRQVKIVDFNAGSGPLTLGQPIQVTATTRIESTKPALQGTVALNGTVAYDLDQGRFTLKPFETTGKFAGRNLPGGTADLRLSAAADVDLDAETAALQDLHLDALGVIVRGTLNASQIKSEHPAGSGELTLTGSDLALVFKAFEIEPLATQLAAVSDKSFTANVTVDVNAKTGTLYVPELKAKMLGATFAGKVTGEKIHTAAATVKGDLSARGPDLPTLLKVVGQLEGGKQSKLARLASELAGTKAPGFDLAAQFDTDLGNGGNLAVSNLTVSALGTSVTGSLVGVGFRTSAPAYRGDIVAQGSDLPLLLRGASVFEKGDEPKLNSLAKRLSTAKTKSFALASRFDADFKAKKIDVPEFTVDALGLSAKGRLKTAKDDVNGEFNLGGATVGDLLQAVGQKSLAEVVRTIHAQTRVSGSLGNLTLHPLELRATFAGDASSEKPPELVLNTAANVNLDKETLRLTALRLSGLGIDLQGDVDATQFRSDKAAYKGTLKLAPFAPRTLLGHLNQDLPPMADPKALQKLAASATVSGTATGAAVTDLVVQLDGSELKGKVTVEDFSDPDITFGFTVDTLDVDRYQPASKGAGGKKRADASGATKGAPPAALPVEALRALKLNGDLTVGQMKVSGVKLGNVKLTVKARDGKLVLDPMAADLYQGTYKGSVGIDATGTTPKVDLDSRLDGVQAEPLLTDLRGKSRLRGRGSLVARLNASGQDPVSMKRSLTGEATLAFRDGAIKGIDIGKVLRMLKGGVLSIDETQSTAFTELDATVTCSAGVCRNQDLDVKSPLLRLGGSGVVVDLATDRIDYTLRATAVGSAGGDVDKLKGVAVPIKVSGTTDDPKFAPDFGGLAKEGLKQQLEKQIDKRLGTDKPGSGAKDAIKDKLKGILKF